MARTFERQLPRWAPSEGASIAAPIIQGLAGAGQAFMGEYDQAQQMKRAQLAAQQRMAFEREKMGLEQQGRERVATIGATSRLGAAGIQAGATRYGTDVRHKEFGQQFKATQDRFDAEQLLSREKEITDMAQGQVPIPVGQLAGAQGFDRAFMLQDLQVKAANARKGIEAGKETRKDARGNRRDAAAVRAAGLTRTADNAMVGLTSKRIGDELEMRKKLVNLSSQHEGVRELYGSNDALLIQAAVDAQANGQLTPEVDAQLEQVIDRTAAKLYGHLSPEEREKKAEEMYQQTVGIYTSVPRR